MKVGAAGEAEAKLDRQELERELRAVSTNDEFDRQALEAELWRSGPDGAAAAWERVDARLRAERAGLDRIRDELPANPLDALSWVCELGETAARWCAWETIRLRGEREGGRTWATLQAAEAELQEELARSRNGRAGPASGCLKAECWTVALDLVAGEMRELIAAHRAAVVALYGRARRAGFA